MTPGKTKTKHKEFWKQHGDHFFFQIFCIRPVPGTPLLQLRGICNFGGFGFLNGVFDEVFACHSLRWHGAICPFAGPSHLHHLD